MTVSYSIVCTSCQRDWLLAETFNSLMESIDWNPTEIIVVDDGPDRPRPDCLRKWEHLNVRWICNGRRLGQMATCDRAMQEATNEHILFIEEDWLFRGSGWLRESFDILDNYPEVSTVSLRANDCNGHPNQDYDKSKGKFWIQVPGWRGGFGGINFNPGARRKSDYTRIGSYQKHTRPENGNLGGELALSQLYTNLGYVIAVLKNGPYIQHLGSGFSKASEKVEIKEPKILIAVKAGQTLSYTRWESERSPSYDPKIAWDGKPYDTSEKPIHVTGPNNRLAAVRETWWKDTQSVPNLTAKFFFGSPALGTPKDDEVYLPVPDDYAHLAPKTKEICRWAVEHDFDYAVFVDDDTAVYVDRLVAEINMLSADYAGYTNGNMCSGGAGYILSRRALEEIVRNAQTHWAEDCMVGKTLHYAGISPVHLMGHRSGRSSHHFFTDDVFNPALLDGTEVAMHAVFPDTMRKWYEHKNR